MKVNMKNKIVLNKKNSIKPLRGNIIIQKNEIESHADKQLNKFIERRLNIKEIEKIVKCKKGKIHTSKQIKKFRDLKQNEIDRLRQGDIDSLTKEERDIITSTKKLKDEIEEIFNDCELTLLQKAILRQNIGLYLIKVEGEKLNEI